MKKITLLFVELFKIWVLFFILCCWILISSVYAAGSAIPACFLSVVVFRSEHLKAPPFCFWPDPFYNFSYQKAFFFSVSRVVLRSLPSAGLQVLVFSPRSWFRWFFPARSLVFSLSPEPAHELVFGRWLRGLVMSLVPSSAGVVSRSSFRSTSVDSVVPPGLGFSCVLFFPANFVFALGPARVIGSPARLGVSTAAACVFSIGPPSRCLLIWFPAAARQGMAWVLFLLHAPCLIARIWLLTTWAGPAVGKAPIFSLIPVCPRCVCCLGCILVSFLSRWIKMSEFFSFSLHSRVVFWSLMSGVRWNVSEILSCSFGLILVVEASLMTCLVSTDAFVVIRYFLTQFWAPIVFLYLCGLGWVRREAR
jgi:hypothetical protein